MHIAEPAEQATHATGPNGAQPDRTGQVTGEGSPTREKKALRWLRPEVRWGVTAFLAVLVVEYFVLPQLAGARKALRLLGQVNAGFMVLGLVLEVGALVAYSQLTHTVLPAGSPSRPRLMKINLSTLAVSHVAPGGTAAGAPVLYRLLTESGVRTADATFALAMQGVGSAAVLNMIFWLALVVSIPMHGYNPIYGVAATAGAVMLAIFATILLMLTRARDRSLGIVRKFARWAHWAPFVDPESVVGGVDRLAERLAALLRTPPLLYRALLWATANWLLDAASLWVFVASFHHLVNPVDLLVAYGMANVLAVIPITPSGLGVIEGVLIPTLAGFGVPKGAAILGVLAYRLGNFWLPIPAGGAAYLSLRLEGSAKRP